VDRCLSLLDRDDVPEHVRALTSNHVLDVEADLELRLVTRADTGADTRTEPPVAQGSMSGNLDSAQLQAATALAGTAGLVVVEGAAGAGKTATLAAVRDLLTVNRHRLLIVTPTLKAAHAAEREVGTGAHSAGWLVHQYGFRWDEHGRWSREDSRPPVGRGLEKGDLLVVDEAGMLDQDTARALLAIADETGARLALIGDRHQLPAVGRGGVLDLAARWAPPGAHLTLDTLHRFVDQEYADLTLLMRTGDQASDVFDALLQRGEIVLHPSEVERTEAFAELDGLVMADTRDQVRDLNAAIRDHRSEQAFGPAAITTVRGERVGLGDPIVTRRNDRDLDVANRDTWTVTGVAAEGRLRVSGERGERILPAAYVRADVELAYATTVYGAQGQTVDTAHLLVGEGTGAAAAYVGMTRGRQRNVAHLVAESVDEARLQWVRTFSRDRADLGPAHAAQVAGQDIERYGPVARPSVPRRRPTEPLPLPNRLEPTQGVGI
jgi:exodeoxyribonuclease V alpha subunit